MTTKSVLDQALALSAIASALREGAAAEDAAKRIMTKADELTAVIDNIESVIGAADRLAERGAQVSLSPLDDGYEAFSRLTPDGGIPPMRAFAPAKAKLESVHKQVRTSVSQAWHQWTSARLTELARHRLLLLPPVERQTQETRWTKLVKLNKVEVPSRSDVVEFATLHAGLKEVLDSYEDPVPELQILLDRLTRRTTLAHLSDDDIALLRQHGVADQIELQRRSV